jgi:hypothetical protein
MLPSSLLVAGMLLVPFYPYKQGIVNFEIYGLEGSMKCN